VKINTARNSIH